MPCSSCVVLSHPLSPGEQHWWPVSSWNNPIPTPLHPDRALPCEVCTSPSHQQPVSPAGCSRKHCQSFSKGKPHPLPHLINGSSPIDQVTQAGLWLSTQLLPPPPLALCLLLTQQRMKTHLSQPFVSIILIEI